MYLASADNNATELFFLELHEITFDPIQNTYPNVLFLPS
jgi:hypothetical protein